MSVGRFCVLPTKSAARLWNVGLSVRGRAGCQSKARGEKYLVYICVYKEQQYINSSSIQYKESSAFDDRKGKSWKQFPEMRTRADVAITWKMSHAQKKKKGKKWQKKNKWRGKNTPDWLTLRAPPCVSTFHHAAWQPAGFLFFFLF